MKKSILLLFSMISCVAAAQMSIQPFPVNEWLVNPSQILRADIINPGAGQEGRLQTEIRSKNGLTLVNAVSLSFKIQTGITRHEPSVAASVNYSDTDEGQYIKNYMILPTGEYDICYSLFLLNSSEQVESVCLSIKVSTINSIYLVSPFDGEKLETVNPVLVWNVSKSGESNSNSHYEMIVAEWDKKVSRERAIAMEPTLHISDLSTLQVYYSSDMPALESGKRYVWQVLRIEGNQVIDKTDIWSFSIKKAEPVIAYYAVLRREPDGGAYMPVDDKVNFRFDESYSSGSKPEIRITDSKGHIIRPSVINTNLKEEVEDLKVTGFNQFSFDVSSFNLRKGNYNMIVTDEKGFDYTLRILIK